jgi:hypothetical protein
MLSHRKSCENEMRGPFSSSKKHADGAQLQVAKLITLRALSVLRVRAGCPQEQGCGEQ